MTRALARALAQPDNVFAWYEVAKEGDYDFRQMLDLAEANGITDIRAMSIGYREYIERRISRK